jgi:Prokaryotic homologs of the JAB domain
VKRFLSLDAELAVSVGDEAWASIVERCMAAGRSETGGILIGRYTRWRDRAEVIEATGPPRDSRFWPFAFWRGLRGLRAILATRWEESGTYYLGEWHFHPCMSAEPSGTDLTQMRRFAADPAYRCPKPVLVVVGGDPSVAAEVTVSVINGDEVLPLEELTERELQSDAPPTSDRRILDSESRGRTGGPAA